MKHNADSPLMALDADLTELEQKIEQLRNVEGDGTDVAQELANHQAEAERLAAEVADAIGDADAWDRVQMARHPKRPYTLDYIQMATDEFFELHGDRRFGDDPAIVAGMAQVAGRPVAIVGHQKGRSGAERRRRNFGAAGPEGYRKALRVMELAARWGRPIVTLIDTPGADCLEEAESRGISEAIAVNQREMFRLPVPIVSVVIGEGGSGGAIGIGVGDRVLMMEHAYYSVIAPESCAAILWRDASKKQEMADALKLTANDAVALGCVDGVISEPPGAAHRDPAAAALELRTAVLSCLDELGCLPAETLMEARYEKFRRMGAPA